MSYQFTTTTNYLFSLAGVHTNPAVPQLIEVSYKFLYETPYTFNYDLDLNQPPSELYPFKTRRYCFNINDGLLISDTIISDTNHTTSKSVSKYFNNNDAIININHLCTNINKKSTSYAKYNITVDNALLNIKKYCTTIEFNNVINSHYCLDNNNSNTVTNYTISYIDNVISYHNHKCFNIKFAAVNNLNVKYGYTWTDFILKSTDYNHTADIAILELSTVVVGDSNYTFTNSNVYDFSNNYTFANAYIYNLANTYKFEGNNTYGIISNNPVLGCIVNHTCYNTIVAKRNYNHVCVIIDDGKKPPRGASVIVTPPPIVINPIMPTQYTVPTKNTYITKPDIVVRLNGIIQSDNLSIVSFNAALDINSHSWSYSITLADMTVLDTINVNDIITVDLGIAGYVFDVYVERINKTTRFTGSSGIITGRGLTAELASPISAPANVTYGSALTVNQLIALQVPQAWSLTFSGLDWVIPAFTYSVENKTPAAVLLDICEKVGFTILPSPTGKAITVREIYPIKPWAYNPTVFDYKIPAAAIYEYTTGLSNLVDSDCVFVHGTGAGAILSKVKITGQAGTKPIPTASNELITDANAARTLGGRLLASAGSVSPLESITIKGLDSLPLIMPASTVNIDNIMGTTTSYSLSMTVQNDGSIDIETTLGLGEGNLSLYSSFYDLIPRSPLTIGTASNIDGVNVVMSTLDGGSYRVAGTAIIGNKYYTNQGLIVGPAPTLTEVPLDV